MLEDVAKVPRQGHIFRFVNQKKHVETLREMGLDTEAISEVVSLLEEHGLTDDPTEVLDGPFAHKPLLKPRQTRFSDGTVRVFYSALEPETAEREQEHRFLKLLLDDQPTPLRAVYRCVQCTFTGEVKDLRPWVDRWSFLIADGGYEQCNLLGAEAAESGLGGLLSQSARRLEGTTSPVFSRRCLSGVEFQGYRVFDYDPGTRTVKISSP